MKRWRTSGLVSLVLLAAAGCPSKTPPAASGDAGPRAAVDGTVTDYLGNAVAGAQLSSGGATATTASDGTYTLSGVPTPDGGTAVVAVTAAGYLDTAYGVAVTAGETTELDPVIMPMSPSQPLDATAGGTVTGVRGASLTAGPGVFVDSSGHTVSGQVDVALTPLTPGVAGLIQAYPGNLKALDASGNPVLLETHGVLDVSVEQNGQKLQIASGKTVSVTIPAAVVGALPSASGLWSFDMGTALWKAEGAATLLGTVYSAVLPHLSFWNIDCSNSAGTPVVCLRGDLRTCNGDAIIGAQITVTANDDSYATGTQGSGAFCVALPPGGGSDAGPFSDDVRCATSVSASAWDIRIQGKGLDVSVTVQAPTQGTNQGQPTFSCDVMEGAGECINLHNVGCVGDGGLLIVLDGGSSCSYWQTDGGPGAGDAGVLDPFLGTCAAPLASLFTCFNGSGGCSFDGNLDAGQITYTYANGSKETVALLGAGQANAQIGYYGPDGGLCGTVSTFGSGVDFVIGGAVYDLTSTGDVTTTITCPDGGSLTLNDDQSNTAQGCASNLGGGAGACKASKGPGTPCQTDADCGGPYLTTCCQDAVLGSICLAGNACDLYWDAGCQTSAQCFSATDNTCCTSLQETLGFGLCLPTGACSSCGPSSPCPSGQSCCTPAGSGQSFCVAGTSCGNQCTSNADCGSDLCCPEPDSSTKFCTPASGGVCATGACQTSADCPSSPSEPLGCCLPSATTLYGTCVPLQNGTLPASCAQ